MSLSRRAATVYQENATQRDVYGSEGHANFSIRMNVAGHESSEVRAPGPHESQEEGIVLMEASGEQERVQSACQLEVPTVTERDCVTCT